MVNPGTHHVDDSSPILIGDDPRKFNLVGYSLATLPVGWVNARGDNPDSDLARTWSRVGHDPEFQDISVAILLIPNSFHD